MVQDHAVKMKARMRLDLVAAIKARRLDETAVLRSLLAAIDNAEAPEIHSGLVLEPSPISPRPSAEVERLLLAGAELREVLLQEIRDREQAAAEMAGMGCKERGDALLRQARIARRYID